jgi:hypothetical protein
MTKGNVVPGDSSELSSPAEIEQTRAELADSVDQLSDKLSSKSQFGHRVESVRQAVSTGAAKAEAAAPPQVQHAVEKVGEQVGAVAHQVNVKTEPHRSKIVAGAAAALALVVGLVLLQRKRRNDN